MNQKNQARLEVQVAETDDVINITVDVPDSLLKALGPIDDPAMRIIKLIKNALHTDSAQVEARQSNKIGDSLLLEFLDENTIIN